MRRSTLGVIASQGANLNPFADYLQVLFAANKTAFTGNEVIDYSPTKANGLLVKSNCLQPVTDITITLSTPRVGATVTEVNLSATTTGVTINGSGHIAIVKNSLPNPKIYQIKLSSGEVFIFSIGALNNVYSVSDTANTGTFSGVVTTNWIWSTQDDYHYNIKNGCNAWQDCSGVLKPLKPFRLTTKFDSVLEFDIIVKSAKVLLCGAVDAPYFYLQATYLNIVFYTDYQAYSFTNLGTNGVDWLVNPKHVKVEIIKSLGTYGGIKVTVSNLDGSSSVNQTVLSPSAKEFVGDFYTAGGFGSLGLASGSLIKNITYNGVDLTYYDVFYPIKSTSDVDVLGNTCTRNANKYIACETKIKLNPNNNTDLTTAGYSTAYERAFSKVNPYYGREFCGYGENYLITKSNLDYAGIIQLSTKFGELVNVLKIGSDKSIKSVGQTRCLLGKVGLGFIYLLTDNLYTEKDIIPSEYSRTIGVNNPQIVGYLPASSTKADISTMCTIWYSGLTVILENFRVSAQNMRYALHSDLSTANGLVQTLNKITAEHLGNLEAVAYYNVLDGTGVAVWATTSGLGMGLGSANTMNMNDCDFIGHNEAGLFIHNKATAGTANTVNLKNVSSKRTYGTITRALYFNNLSRSGDRFNLDNVTAIDATDATFDGVHEDHYTNVAGVLNGYFLMN